MHDKIKELAIEAGLYVDFNGRPWPKNMNGEDIEGAYQKFAELLINECALVVQKKVGPKSALNVLEHFGIEND